MKNRKYVSALISLLFIVLNFGLTSTYAQSVDPPNFKWDLVTTWPANLSIFHENVEKFADEVRLISKGRLDITVYAAGEKVDALETFNAVSEGKVQMGHSASFYWGEKVPGSQIMTTVPFGMTAKGNNAWFYGGNGLEVWRELYANHNIVPFPMGNTGVQTGGWFNKKITTIDDFQGLRMRIPGLGGLVFKKAGGKPVLLPAGDIFSALRDGKIDAADWIGPYHDMELKFHKVARYYYYPGWQEPSATIELLINKKAWEELPGDLQKIVEAVAGYMNVYIYAQFEALNAKALKELREYHPEIEILPFPDEIMEQLKRYTDEVIKEQVKTYPEFKRVYEKYRNFRQDHDEWSSISDDAYKSGRTNNFNRKRASEELIKELRNQKNVREIRPEGPILLISLKGDVTFDTGSSKVKPGLSLTIERLANIIFKYPSRFIMVEGHTDSSGNEVLNLLLSKQRANAVKELLIQQRVNASQIDVIPLGESQPIASNETEMGRRQNRRIEIKVIF